MKIESDDEKLLLELYRRLCKSGYDECSLEKRAPSNIHWITVKIAPFAEYSDDPEQEEDTW